MSWHSLIYIVLFKLKKKNLQNLKQMLNIAKITCFFKLILIMYVNKSLQILSAALS